MRKELSPSAKKLLDHYFHIKVGQFEVRCPYFMNVKKSRGLSEVFSGKGLPLEIEKEAAKILAKRVSIVVSGSHSNKTAADASDFLILCGLGIDCSGLVMNVLDRHWLESKGKSLYSSIHHPNIYSRLMSYLRPRMHVWANLLTGTLNSTEVSLAQIKPGDLLRQGNRHVLLIEWVDSAGDKVTKIGYAESNTRPEWGVQRGEIIVTNINKSLGEQKWSVEMAQQRFIRTPDSKIVRINA